MFGLWYMEFDFSVRVIIYQVFLFKDLIGVVDFFQFYIVGIQSFDQQVVLVCYNLVWFVFVEGFFFLWFCNKCVYYYIFRVDLLFLEEREVEEMLEEWNFYYLMQLDLEYVRSGWDNYEFDINEVEEGFVFVMCMVGVYDQVMMVKWIQGLQEINLILVQIFVVFCFVGFIWEFQIFFCRVGGVVFV